MLRTSNKLVKACSGAAGSVVAFTMSKQAGMKALVVRQLGNPVPSPTEKKPYAVIADHPTPQYLAPNAVRIKIAASGLNFADALQVMVTSVRLLTSGLHLTVYSATLASQHAGPVPGQTKAAIHTRIRSIRQDHRDR